MEPCQDPNHSGNAASYHTGKPCIEKGCERPAGTWWSKHWCQPCNAARLTRITGNLEALAQLTPAQTLIDTLMAMGATVTPHRPVTVGTPHEQ